jgi:NADPH:quinone reductase-like Zn-dependent oxidoreductase
MRAWRVNELWHPSESLRLEHIADPVAGDGQILIRVEAGNVNRAI